MTMRSCSSVLVLTHPDLSVCAWPTLHKRSTPTLRPPTCDLRPHQLERASVRKVASLGSERRPCGRSLIAPFMLKPQQAANRWTGHVRGAHLCELVGAVAGRAPSRESRAGGKRSPPRASGAVPPHMSSQPQHRLLAESPPASGGEPDVRCCTSPLPCDFSPAAAAATAPPTGAREYTRTYGVALPGQRESRGVCVSSSPSSFSCSGRRSNEYAPELASGPVCTTAPTRVYLGGASSCVVRHSTGTSSVEGNATRCITFLSESVAKSYEYRRRTTRMSSGHGASGWMRLVDAFRCPHCWHSWIGLLSSPCISLSHIAPSAPSSVSCFGAATSATMCVMVDCCEASVLQTLHVVVCLSPRVTSFAIDGCDSASRSITSAASDELSAPATSAVAGSFATPSASRTAWRDVIRSALADRPPLSTGGARSRHRAQALTSAADDWWRGEV
mmetsp:Transcript_5679/g.14517  ORF Transcript_5679/g.14517 Transcript_5679/m.14517 type:complete len:445 (-) Transcript_5679:13-1347(-)